MHVIGIRVRYNKSLTSVLGDKDVLLRMEAKTKIILDFNF